MLGFQPQQYHFDLEPAPLPEYPEDLQEAPAHEHQIFAALRDENRLLSMEAASYTHHAKGKREQHLDASSSRWSDVRQVKLLTIVAAPQWFSRHYAFRQGEQGKEPFASLD